MIQKVGKEEGQEFDREDLENFPCSDLRIINQLWLQYSDGKFGFSVQKEIYESLGGTGEYNKEYNKEVCEKFGERVGWRKGENWLNYSDLTFDKSAPQAHLPVTHIQRNRDYWDLDYYSIKLELAIEKAIGTERSLLLCSFAQRLVTCKI